MIEDAKKYDLDLSDPLVIQELKRLQRDGVDGEMPPFPEGVDEEEYIRQQAETSGGQWSGSSGGSVSEEATDLPLPDVDLSVPTPWLRYVVLFGLMFVFFKLL